MSSHLPALLVSGICLTGKTTLANELRKCLNVDGVIEGDDLHTEASIEKMRAGHPLSEADREIWKTRICAEIQTRPRNAWRIITCSALTRTFRNDLRAAGDVRFIFLICSREGIEKRAAKRLREDPDHFFQPALHQALLDGQYRDLQVPGADESDCYLIDLDTFSGDESGPQVDFVSLSSEIEKWLNSSHL